MFTYNVLGGATDFSVVIRIVDSADGTPELGVLFNTAGMALQYRRELAANVAITEATLAALTTAHADGGFLEIGNGYYRLDLPDAAVAAGVRGCLVHGIVTGMVVIGCYIEILGYDQTAALATPTNITAGTITTVTNLTNAPTAGDLTATMKTSVTTAVPTAAVIADAVLDEDMTAHQTQGSLGQAIGDPVAVTDSIYKAVVTDATGATVGVDIVAMKVDTAAILVDTGTTLDARIPAALVSGRMDASVGAIAANAITAASMAADAGAEIADAVWDEDATGHQTQGTFGQAIGDPVADTNTIFKAVVTDAAGVNIAADIVAVKAETAEIVADTAEIGAAGAGLTNINLPNQTMDIVGNITGNLSGTVGSVTGAVGSVTGAVGSVTGNVGGNVTGTIGGLTAAALKDFFDTDSATTYASAVAGSVVKEIADNAGGGTPPTAAAIADAVWDETMADHLTGGSTGASLNGAGSAGDPWTTPLPGAYGSGTAGKILGDNINATISSRASQTSVDNIDTKIGTPTNLAGSGATVSDMVLDTYGVTDASYLAIAGASGVVDDVHSIMNRIPAALSAGGNMKSDVLSLGGVVQSLTDLKDFADDGYDPATNKVQGVVLVDTATNLTNAPTNGDFTAAMKASINTEADTALTDYDAPTRAELTTDTNSILTVVNEVPTNAELATAIGAMTLTAAERAAIADAWINRNIAGGSNAGRTNGEAMATLRNKCVIAGGVLTVYSTDDTTPLFTAAIVTTAGDPISSIDPAT